MPFYDKDMIVKACEVWRTEIAAQRVDLEKSMADKRKAIKDVCAKRGRPATDDDAQRTLDKIIEWHGSPVNLSEERCATFHGAALMAKDDDGVYMTIDEFRELLPYVLAVR